MKIAVLKFKNQSKALNVFLCLILYIYHSYIQLKVHFVETIIINQIILFKIL